MKNIKLILVVISLVASFTLSAQVSINNDGADADASAMLDVKSTEKGMLLPRMSQSEIASIPNPADGLIVYNTDDNRFYFFNASTNEWKEIAVGIRTIIPGCGLAFTDIRDDKSYNTIQIGDQCWMAENLNIGIMLYNSNNQSNNDTIEKYCYGDNTSNCDTYGGLYQWDEMMQYDTTEGIRGICPTGWHLPTHDEWCTLGQEVDPTIDCYSSSWQGVDCGGKLKEAGTTHWSSPNTGATNSSGFTGLPGGYRHPDGTYSYLGDFTLNWSSSQNDSEAYRQGLSYNKAQVLLNRNDRDYSYSVRCLQD